jgi:hypothetical protein
MDVSKEISLERNITQYLKGLPRHRNDLNFDVDISARLFQDFPALPFLFTEDTKGTKEFDQIAPDRLVVNASIDIDFQKRRPRAALTASIVPSRLNVWQCRRPQPRASELYGWLEPLEVPRIVRILRSVTTSKSF